MPIFTYDKRSTNPPNIFLTLRARITTRFCNQCVFTVNISFNLKMCGWFLNFFNTPVPIASSLLKIKFIKL